MATSAKAEKIAAELVDRLKVRKAIGAKTISMSFAADGNPLIQIGTLATTDEGCLIKVMPADWPLAVDVLGNAAFAYTPHVIKLLKEASPAGGLDADEIMELQAQIALMGCEVKLYESASGSGVVLADLSDETKLVVAFSPDPYRPLISAQ